MTTTVPLGTAVPDRPVFVRDRLTGMAYGGLALYAFLLYALGPLLPLLRDDLRLSYTVMSLHSTAFAAGAVLTNLVFERARRRFGYRTLFWAAAVGLVLGGLLLATGRSVAMTLTAAAVSGIGGALLQTTALAVLAEHHGPLRDRALVEANAGASATALAAPLVIGALQTAGAAWNWTLLVPPVAAAVLYAVFRHDRLRPRSDVSAHAGAPPGRGGAANDGGSVDGGGPADECGPVDDGGRLPAAFWLLAALCGVAVGAEFCLVFYGSPQLTGVVGLTAGSAATAMSLFYAGALLGRLAGSRLTASRRLAELIFAALGVSVAGFLTLWATGSAWVALTGLFLSGFGMANLFPLALSLAVSAAPGSTGRATAYVQLLVGTAIMLAPLLLGGLSDRLGVRTAFGLAGLLLPLAALLLLLGRRAAAATPPVPAPTSTPAAATASQGVS
ncbi:MFS transporter [Streptomyces sp. NPDC005322]|uniref:MFS transporter n=1 Tax=unclassified Streptomyces TaxID=2593676 RepID=UPI0033B93BB3